MGTTMRAVHICGTATFKQGDPPPPSHDYLGWQSWAEAQYKAGLRQSRCGRCGLYRFPQELDADATALAGESVCRACAGKGVA